MSHEHLVKFPKGEVDPQGLVSIKRAAKLLDVKPSTMYHWIAKGQLRAYKINGSVRLKANEFLRWVDIHARPS